jgi:hypothetical protein
MCCPWWLHQGAIVTKTSYSIGERAFLVTRVCETELEFCVKLGCRKAPVKYAINELYNKLETTLSMKGVACKKSVTTPDIIHHVE